MSLYVDFHTEVKIDGKWVNIDPTIYNIEEGKEKKVSTYWNGSRTCIGETLDYCHKVGYVISKEDLGVGTKERYAEWTEPYDSSTFTVVNYKDLTPVEEFDSVAVLRKDIAEAFEKGELSEDEAYHYGTVDVETYLGEVKAVRYNSEIGVNKFLKIIKDKVDERIALFENENYFVKNIEYRIVVVWS